MSQPKIIAYLKPTCGWSQGVRAILRKYQLPYDDRDILNVPEYREEMMQKSGQPFSPCVEVDGEMLADISGQELEQWLIGKGLVHPSDREADAPTDQGCSGEHHGEIPVRINF